MNQSSFRPASAQRTANHITIPSVRSTAAFFALVLFETACAGRGQLDFDIPLRQVERPASVQARYGPQVITAPSESGTGRFLFEDNLVRVYWFVTPMQFSAKIYNKTDNSLRIVWDEAVAVDNTGQSHPVMHGGTKFTNCTETKAPSVIAKRAMIDDVILPCYTFTFDPTVGWVQTATIFRGLSPWQTATSRNARYLNEILKGRRVQLLLPIEVQGIVNEYLFTFEVAKVELTRAIRQ